MRPVFFLNSHPIQYFAPLYQQVSATTNTDLTVYYCSDESIKGKLDKGFGTKVKWDIPLLDGYKSVFIKNRSWKPSIHKGFWGLFNTGIISLLYKQPKSVIVVHGWAYSTHVMTIIFGKIFGHRVCLRSETPLNQELKKNKAITFLKHLYLRFLFLFVDKFLYIGKQNKLFYQRLGVKEKDLVFAPYSVDNKRFRNIFETTNKEAVKQQLKLPVGKKIILYSGKYIYKKRPLDLLKAFNELKDKTGALLVFAGDGECRAEMEAFIKEQQLGDHVLLTGFINQSEIPLYYRAADIFVMCSGLGETWGLSVNEAMNFGVPIIVSDTCGCAYDLVEKDSNGAVFETGNIQQLADLLNDYLNRSPEAINTIQQAAFKKIDQYSYNQVITAIETVQ
ncbi:MAG: glycosyltransferase family 4 protein [Ferruginibacter sp.]